MLHILLDARNPRAQLVDSLGEARIAQSYYAQLGRELCAFRVAYLQNIVRDRVYAVYDLGLCEPFAENIQNIAAEAAGYKIRPSLGRDRQHKAVAQERVRLIQQRRGILTVAPELIKQPERLVGVPLDGMIQKLRRAAVACQSHGRVYGVGVYIALARALIEQRQRVAHAALGKSRNELGRTALEPEPLALCDVLEMPGYKLRVKALEAVPLAAREYRRRYFIELRRCKDEHQVLRRLLENFQQGIERRRGQHVHLVDDVHALFDRDGRKHGLLAQLADVIHAVIGRGVDLDNVHDAAVLDAEAGRALPAGVAVFRVLAVERLGEDLGAGRLARAARSDEKIRVRGPARGYLIFKRFRYVLLPDDLVKGLRTPLPI